MGTAAETGSVVAAAAEVAMAAADNNKNCGGRQQSTNCGSADGSGGSGCGSSNCGSLAATAGLGGGAVEVTTMRVMATDATVVVILYPLFPLAMVR